MNRLEFWFNPSTYIIHAYFGLIVSVLFFGSAWINYQMFLELYIVAYWFLAYALFWAFKDLKEGELHCNRFTENR